MLEQSLTTQRDMLRNSINKLKWNSNNCSSIPQEGIIEKIEMKKTERTENKK